MRKRSGAARAPCSRHGMYKTVFDEKVGVQRETREARASTHLPCPRAKVLHVAQFCVHYIVGAALRTTLSEASKLAGFLKFVLFFVAFFCT
jgi:hypothetical protein